MSKEQIIKSLVTNHRAFKANVVSSQDHLEATTKDIMALFPALKWTREKPYKQGAYFVRGKLKQARLVYVTEAGYLMKALETPRVTGEPPIVFALSEYPDHYEWAGPIEMPEEPEEPKLVKAEPSEYEWGCPNCGADNLYGGRLSKELVKNLTVICRKCEQEVKLEC